MMARAPRAPYSAAPQLHYPKTAPPWVVQTLNAMAAKGQLHGVPPQVMAGFARTESDYGGTGSTPGSVTQLPVQTSTPGTGGGPYGGYFGLGPAQRAKSGGLNPGIGTFEAQAGLLSSDIGAQLNASHGTYEKAIQAVSGGKPTGSGGDWSYQLQTVFGGKAPTPQQAQLAHWWDPFGPASGLGAVTSGVHQVGPDVRQALGATFNAGGFLRTWGVRIGLVIFGAILILVAVRSLMSQGETEMDRAPGESVTAAAEAEAEKKSSSGDEMEEAELAAA